MDRYKQAEKRLRNLEMDKMYLESLEKDLKILELEYSIRGVSFDGVGDGVGTSDTTADTAIRLTEKKQELELRIAKKKNYIEHIEGVLNCLTEKERAIIEMYYIRYKPYWYIAKEVQYSTSQVKRIKKDAMEKVIIGLFGEV